jgi:hypothetical protein
MSRSTPASDEAMVAILHGLANLQLLEKLKWDGDQTTMTRSFFNLAEAHATQWWFEKLTRSFHYTEGMKVQDFVAQVRARERVFAV